MIFHHLESQFSDKEKNSHIHLTKKYWDFRNWLITNPCFIILFSLLPPSTLRNEYLAMLSDAHQVAHTTYKMLLQVSVYMRHWHQPAIPGGREVAGAINSSSHILHHPTPFHSLQSLGPNELRSHNKSLLKAPLSQASFVIFWLLRPGNRFYLRWVKLERQPIRQRFCLGGDVSQYTL